MLRIKIILLVCVSGLAFGQDYQWNTINSDNSGLPNQTVKSIAVDSEGALWIGTYMGGVAVKKGDDWTIYNTSNSELPHNYVNSIAIDKNNVKWIGTDGGGLARFDGNAWQVFKTSNSGIPSNVVMTTYCDDDGSVWIGTYFGGLAHFSNGLWKIYNDENSPLLSNKVVYITKDKKGVLWLGTQGGGVASFDGADWNIYTERNSKLTNDYIYSIAIDEENKKWIGTGGGGVAIFNDVFWIKYTTSNSGLTDDNIRPLVIDPTNRKWVGTYIGGINLLQDREWQVFDFQNSSMPDDEITCMIYHLNNIYVGTERSGVINLAFNNLVEPELPEIEPEPEIITQTETSIDSAALQAEVTEETVIDSVLIVAEDPVDIIVQQDSIASEPPVVIVEQEESPITKIVEEVVTEPEIPVIDIPAETEIQTDTLIAETPTEIDETPEVIVEDTTMTEVQEILIAEEPEDDTPDTTLTIIEEEPIVSDTVIVADVQPAEEEIIAPAPAITTFNTDNQIVLMMDVADVYFDSKKLKQTLRSFRYALNYREKINSSYTVKLLIYSTNYDINPKKLNLDPREIEKLQVKEIVYLEGESTFTEGVSRAFKIISANYFKEGRNTVIAATHKFIRDDESSKVVIQDNLDKHNIEFSLLAFRSKSWKMEHKMRRIIPKEGGRYYSITMPGIKDNWGVTAQLGPSLFRGDVDVNKIINPIGVIGISANKQLLSTGIFNGGAKAQFNFGWLKGEKNTQSFENSFKEFNITFQAIMNRWINRNFRFEKFRPYAFAGIGMINYRVLLRNSENLVVNGYGYEVKEDNPAFNGTNPNKTSAVSEVIFPLGIGVNYMINSEFSIEAEASSRYINSDKLDAKLRFRDDKYWFVTVGITYKINQKKFLLDILSK